MSKEKAPAFQFYPKDFLTDEKVVLMSNTETGIYIRLLCFCWLEGTLPLDTESLTRMARMPLKQFTKLWEKSPLRSCFFVADDGRLHHGRLDQEREKQEIFARRQSDNGKKGGKPRGLDTQAFAKPNPNDSQLPTSGLPRQSSPVSYLQSPVSRLLSEVQQHEQADEIGERARRLLEHYTDWFVELRRGARTRLTHNQREFQEACELCRQWDDARLEKLARIVLTTDEAFITRTDRSFWIFAKKASWADDRLTEAERGKTA